jgi:putative transposase
MALFPFCLSYRDVEELLFVRGMIVSYEAIRKWCRKFGQQYANQLRRRRPRLGDKWHLDEVFLTMHGERHYLWRAVDQDGHVLDILVQRRRDKPAAKKFFRKLLKGCRYVPRVVITDKLRSYGAAKREILPGVRLASVGQLRGFVLSQGFAFELIGHAPIIRITQEMRYP